MKALTFGILLPVAAYAAYADVPRKEDFMAARDRIEWNAGALYDGRFEDGVAFEIELAYPAPAGVSKRDADGFVQTVWEPRHYQGEPSGLFAVNAGDATMRLKVLDEHSAENGAIYTITLAPDRATGRGTLTVPAGKPRSFTLRRSVPYTGIVVTRPAPPDLVDNSYYKQKGFVFSTFFPTLGDPAADAWIRGRAGICRDEGECSNNVRIQWRSPSLVSLTSMVWGDSGGAHGDGYFETRQYRLDGRTMTPLGLDAFIDLGDDCRATISAYMVAKLRAKAMPQADKGTLDGRDAAPFTPTSNGIAFHFNLYELGGYAYGAPTVFVPRAQMGACVKYLPAD
ncbi:RsiV family protein [Massilia horti]|uniref:DUF3298 domain-containing protein n=1 Tax=Massilia horti TaxID=2562153 RepID=A0A4Y9SZP8_9BURK|nr:RsiV family protein [Massilia horti]TFW32226.1 DUF3298 domain-containing protein [Massilia horti]